jgi:hypothetical protein
MVDVFVNGVKFVNGTDFTATDGTTVALAAGLAAGNIVEIDNLLTAYLPTNALRTITTFTATAGQSAFSVSYTQGLIDVFYNGSCLAQSEYIAINGTSVTLVTACQVNDIVVVYAYSYSVGAYSGIGGSGTINTIPKFTAASTIGDSAITDNGTTVTLVSRALSGTSATFIVNQNSTITNSFQNINTTNTNTRNILNVIAGNVTTEIQSIHNDHSYFNVTNNLYFQSGGSVKMTMLSTGNVGIGTSSPSYTLSFNGDIATTIGMNQGTLGTQVPLTLKGSDGPNGTNNEGGPIYISSGLGTGNANTSNIIFSTAPSGNSGSTRQTLTERMRITSGGNLLVANTAATGGYDHSFNNVGGSSGTIVFNQTSSATNPCAGFWNNATSGDNIFQRFFVNAGGNQKGSIDFNRGGDVTRYNTTSDGNLKNIIGDSNRQKSIEILNTTRIREYSWKEDETNKPQIGVIAQELYETYKGAVSKGSDDELFGTEDYKEWGVDKTAFTFHLIAGWQKHEQMIQEMNTKIIQLEKIVATK